MYCPSFRTYVTTNEPHLIIYKDTIEMLLQFITYANTSIQLYHIRLYFSHGGFCILTFLHLLVHLRVNLLALLVYRLYVWSVPTHLREDFVKERRVLSQCSQ